MTEGNTSLIGSETWKALEAHAATNRTLHLRDLFAQDPKRGERLTIEAAGVTSITRRTHYRPDDSLLLQLAGESGLRSRIDAMFRGEKINVTRSERFCM